MSLRVLRKLKGDDDIPTTLERRDDKLSSGSDSAFTSAAETSQSTSKKTTINRFNMFADDANSDTEAKDDDDDEEDQSLALDVSVHQEHGKASEASRKKRKKKKKPKQTGTQDASSALDEVESSVREVNRLLGPSDVSDQQKEKIAGTIAKGFLKIENRNLNPENEMKRIFGSRVVQAEQASGSRRRARGKAPLSRSWLMANPRNWHNIGRRAISMELTETTADCLRFNFVHTRQYQQTQFLFLDAVESYNPDNLVAILNVHPAHIDTLIQFSDVVKTEDSQMAAELIERALYCFESVFHTSFNVAQGNCRIDYRKPENRSFYITLFKHIIFIGQRGCNRTSLEFCKVLLSLDPEGDPLAILLAIDYYALLSEQYDFLIKMYSEWEPIRKLSLLPNFKFSVPLAMFLKSRAGEDQVLLKDADRLLQEALLMFPTWLPSLLDKCSIEPDKETSGCTYFSSFNPTMPQAVVHLIALSVGRSHQLWKDKDVVLWLERNSKEAIKRVNRNDKLIADFAEMRKKYYAQRTPRNVLRHIVLAGIKDATVTLPPDLANSPIYAFDPLPPLDSVASYSRPSPRADAGSNDANNQGLLSLFLRSWLPDFNADENLRAAAANVGNLERARQANGAEARPEGAERNDFRRSVTSLLDAMRDLLNNVNMADVPNDGDDESGDEEPRQE